MKNPTIKLLKDRCEVVGDMWIWTQMVSGSGVPRVWAQGRQVSAYRVAYCLHHKITLQDIKGEVIWPTTEQRDINPANLMRGTRADLIAWRKATGTSQRSAAGIARIISGVRKRSTTKLTPQAVQIIRASTDTCSALGQRFGVTEGTIWAARKGKTWKDSVACTASVFNMGVGA